MNEHAHDQAAPSLIRRMGGGMIRAELWLPLLLLLVAFAAGGSSANQPLRDIVVQLTGVLVLAAAVAGLIGRGFMPDARAPLILIAAIGALMLLQLVPLPADIWSNLAGRRFSGSVLDLIQIEGRARPLSLHPERTILSALALIPGVAMAVAVMRLTTPSRMMLAWAAVGLALASLVLGTMQATVGDPASLTLYRTSHLGLPLGVFANTNHQADLLVIGFVLLGVLAPPHSFRSGGRWSGALIWIYGTMAVLAAGVVATGSRTGIVLLGVGLGAVVLRERLAGHVRLFLAGSAALALGLVLLVLYNPVFARSFADFSDLDDPRFRFWPNVLWAIGEFGWFGTGAGTFDGVYRSAETLETLSASYLNHAHNDYLEIMLEMGIPGMVLLLAFLAYVGVRAVAIIRSGEGGVSRGLAYGGLVCIGLLLLHSAVDYPLRTPLLGTLFGFCVGLITTAPRATAPAAREARPASDGPRMGTVEG